MSIFSFFFFFFKAFVNFQKLIRFYLQAFIVYENGENLRTLIETFFQKLIVSILILTFLDHLNPKTFFVGQPWHCTKNEVFPLRISSVNVDQIRRFLWSHLQRKSLMENVMFCAVW